MKTWIYRRFISIFVLIPLLIIGFLSDIIGETGLKISKRCENKINKIIT